jgi:hypothetical protein
MRAVPSGGDAMVHFGQLGRPDGPEECSFSVENSDTVGTYIAGCYLGELAANEETIEVRLNFLIFAS